MNRGQLGALLWLRWRLTCNQWRRHGPLNAVITAIVLVAGLLLAIVGGVGGVLGGALGLPQASPQTTMYVWDGLIAMFLFFWMIGVVTELQRSEILDVGRLLHLPVSLRDVFLLNYLASHLSLSLALMLPAMLGLAAGLLLGKGALLLLLFPLVFGFFFMITAWTYCLRGWLAALMVNKRRRRAIVMAVTMAFVLLVQLPNLLTNVAFRGGRDRPPHNATPEQLDEWLARRKAADQRLQATFTDAHAYVPFLWLPLGASALMEGDPWPAILGACGMIAIGTWGLTRAYHATLRFHQGGENKNKKAAAPASAARPAAPWKPILVERTLPAIPEESGAVALAMFRSLSRAPEVKMALATNVLIFAMLGASILWRDTRSMTDAARSFVASATVMVTFLGLTQLMFNHFGFDRSGFRSLVLLPARRRHILAGKNLALLPAALATFVVYLGLATALAHLGLADVIAAGLEFSGAFLAVSAVGNLASIVVPYRVSAGTLKPTKMSGTTKLLLFVTHLMLPVAMLPVFLPAGLGLLAGLFDGLPGAAIMLLCAALLVVCAALLYWKTLEPLGKLLQRREQAILQVVTQEVE